MLSSVLVGTLLWLPLAAGQQSGQQSLPDAPKPNGTTLPNTSNGIPNAAPLPPEAGVQPARPENETPQIPESNNPPGSADGGRSLAPPKTVADEKELDSIFRVNVQLKIVPVTVKEGNRLVPGLEKSDFVVYENGIRQDLKYFSSEPFPLSSAIVVDTGVSDETLRRIKDTLRSLSGAFGPYDEVAFFSYGANVTQQSDFSSINADKVADALTAINRISGKPNGGVPVTSGPLASGPMVNNRPFDPGQSSRASSPSELRTSHTLNDAVLAAAEALSRRERGRRKLILVISDGNEYNSRNSYSDVLKVLLTNEIVVDGIAVDTNAVPVIGKLEELHIPRLGYSNLLPKYANATGGTIYSQLSRSAIESAYQQATYETRNQYTLGYTPKNTTPGVYRQIEVRVHRPGLKVYAPDGYYPLPPPR